MKKLLAFHNDPKIKEKYLKRVVEHRISDEIVKGIYWQDGKGCAVGCTVETSMDAHAAMEKELGIPEELAYLEDYLFEEMPNDKAKLWPEKFLSAINPGADLSLVIPKFIVWQFEDSKHGLSQIKEVTDDKELVGFCKKVVELYQRVIRGDKVTEDEFYELYLRIDRSDVGFWIRAGTWARARARIRARIRARAWVGAWADYNKNILLQADKLIELLKETN